MREKAPSTLGVSFWLRPKLGSGRGLMVRGCDFHPSWQQVSWVNRETGETGDSKLLPGLNRIRIKESWSRFRPYRCLVQRSVARSVFTEN
jgi:hypothetical protein